MTGLVALILMALALPPLLARLAGGRPPGPFPQLAALAPVAVLPAAAAVIIAAATDRWLAVPLAVPAVLLLIWQLPPRRRISHQAPAEPSRKSGSAQTMVRLRLLTVNAQGGAADPAALLGTVRAHSVDVLAVQELTPQMVRRLAAAGLAQLLPFSHLDPRPGSPGTGLWARWPLTPLPPVPGLFAAAPRARIDPPGGRPVTLTAVHPLAPVSGRTDGWQRELALIRQTLAMTDGPQVVAGDFNASRDHKPFRDLLAAGFLDCADSSQSRSWPGFTWPAGGRKLPVMRLDHVLVSRTTAGLLGEQFLRGLRGGTARSAPQLHVGDGGGPLHPRAGAAFGSGDGKAGQDAYRDAATRRWVHRTFGVDPCYFHTRT